MRVLSYNEEKQTKSSSLEVRRISEADAGYYKCIIGGGKTAGGQETNVAQLQIGTATAITQISERHTHSFSKPPPPSSSFNVEHSRGSKFYLRRRSITSFCLYALASVKFQLY